MENWGRLTQLAQRERSPGDLVRKRANRYLVHRASEKISKWKCPRDIVHENLVYCIWSVVLLPSTITFGMWHHTIVVTISKKTKLKRVSRSLFITRQLKNYLHCVEIRPTSPDVRHKVRIRYIVSANVVCDTLSRIYRPSNFLKTLSHPRIQKWSGRSLKCLIGTVICLAHQSDLFHKTMGLFLLFCVSLLKITVIPKISCQRFSGFQFLLYRSFQFRTLQF